MKIGEIIKENRIRKNLTQEKLASLLSVSPQAVSRWETDAAMPDITLLAPLANLFDITTDSMLGVDTAKKDEKIAGILRRVDELYEERDYVNPENGNGNIDEVIDVLHEGLRLYPDNHSLKFNLAVALYNPPSDRAKRVARWREMNSLCEELIADGGDLYKRALLISYMCTAAEETGNTERMRELTESLPPVNYTEDVLKIYCLRGGERKIARLEAIRSLSGCLSGVLQGFFMRPDEITAQEVLDFRKKAEAIEVILYDGDYISKYCFNDEYQVARALWRLDDYGDALTYLEKIVESYRFLCSDELPQASPLRIEYIPSADAVKRRWDAAFKARETLGYLDREAPEELKALDRYAAVVYELEEIAGMRIHDRS